VDRTVYTGYHGGLGAARGLLTLLRFLG